MWWRTSDFETPRAIPSPRNHTVTLLQDVQVSIRKITVLPWKTSLWCALNNLEQMFPPAIASLRTQFLEGVNFPVNLNLGIGNDGVGWRQFPSAGNMMIARQPPRYISNSRLPSNFLHNHGVAPLDLKPDNVVVNEALTTTAPRLPIYGFWCGRIYHWCWDSIAKQCGTWGTNIGVYSPVLDDRWWC